MKTLVLAFALLTSLVSAQHTGTMAWGASHVLGGPLSGPSRAYMVLRSHTAGKVDLVPLESLRIIGRELVIKTVYASQTGLGGIFNLVTHNDEAFHVDCFEEWALSPVITAMVPPVPSYTSYFVDDNWTVHKVDTPRRRNESSRSHAKRHKKRLMDFWKEFPLNKENTREFALAKARNTKG